MSRHDTDPTPRDANAHPSRSDEQQAAEAVVLADVARQLDLTDLAPAKLTLGDVAVRLDGWSPSRQVAVEVTSRSAAPKGSAEHKWMDDAMRLLLVRAHHRGAGLWLAFASPAAADKLVRQSGWRSAALRQYGIGVLVADVGDDVLGTLGDAATRQFR